MSCNDSASHDNIKNYLNIVLNIYSYKYNLASLIDVLD